MKQTNGPAQIRLFNFTDIETLKRMSNDDVVFVLSCFICECQKENGQDFPPNTVKQMVYAVQAFLETKDIFWKLLEKGGPFRSFRTVVDNLMRERTSQGLGLVNRANIISFDLENKLFSTGRLGDDGPEVLLHMVIYILGVHFMLRGHREHLELRRPGCNPQINVVRDSQGKECLKYVEDPEQKNRRGGIECKKNPKQVCVYPAKDPIRCPMRLYKKYCNLLPLKTSVKTLYLRPLHCPKPRVWYGDQAYGVKWVSTVVRDLVAGLVPEGAKYTNHSLRATAITRMADAGVPDAMIKSKSGHASDSSANLYKRPTEGGMEQASCAVSSSSVSLPVMPKRKHKRKVVGNEFADCSVRSSKSVVARNPDEFDSKYSSSESSEESAEEEKAPLPPPPPKKCHLSLSKMKRVRFDASQPTLVQSPAGQIVININVPQINQ